MDSLPSGPPEQTEPERGEPTVRNVRRDDVRRLSQSLARAFVDDPVSMYLFPGHSRQRRLERYFRYQLKSWFLVKGECYTTDDLRSAALWLPPKTSWEQRPSVSDVALQVPALFVLGRSLGRALRLVQLLEARHPKTAHYYLATIGTDPGVQSRGLGAAVMQPVLRRCDAERIPAYLESSSERSVRFYERLGFVDTGQVFIPGTGTKLWLMWREPSSDPGAPA